MALHRSVVPEAISEEAVGLQEDKQQYIIFAYEFPIRAHISLHIITMSYEGNDRRKPWGIL